MCTWKIILAKNWKYEIFGFLNRVYKGIRSLIFYINHRFFHFFLPFLNNRTKPSLMSPIGVYEWPQQPRNNPHFCSNGFTQKMNILIKSISVPVLQKRCGVANFWKKILILNCCSNALKKFCWLLLTLFSKLVKSKSP